MAGFVGAAGAAETGVFVELLVGWADIPGL
jgi:hypothetical protein